jgi:hypothetical protein
VRRVAGLVFAGVAAVGLLTACGGGSGKQAASSSSSSSSSGFQAYVACLSQHGVTLPSFSPRPRPSVRVSRSPGTDGFGGGGFGGGGFVGRGGLGDPNTPPQGVDAATWSSALSACQSLRPTFGGQQNNSAFTAYRNCLSDHGVTFSGGPAGIPTADPKVAAALRTCAPLRPTPSRRNSTDSPTAAPSPNS